jgi:hypothetical protein
MWLLPAFSLIICWAVFLGFPCGVLHKHSESSIHRHQHTLCQVVWVFSSNLDQVAFATASILSCLALLAVLISFCVGTYGGLHFNPIHFQTGFHLVNGGQHRFLVCLWWLQSAIQSHLWPQLSWDSDCIQGFDQRLDLVDKELFYLQIIMTLQVWVFGERSSIVVEVLCYKLEAIQCFRKHILSCHCHRMFSGVDFQKQAGSIAKPSAEKRYTHRME